MKSNFLQSQLCYMFVTFQEKDFYSSNHYQTVESYTSRALVVLALTELKNNTS